MRLLRRILTSWKFWLTLLVLAAVAAPVAHFAAGKLDTIPDGRPLEVRHAPSGKHSKDDTLQTADSDMAFDQYLANVGNMVRSVVLATPLTKAQMDELLRGADPKKSLSSFQENRIDASTPFEYKAKCEKARGGALLVHGLTDTPFLMRDVGEFLAREPFCLRVRSLLLPGHGTRPADLLGVRRSQWKEAVAYGINSFRDTPGDLYIVGFSTGGALALYHAFHRDKVRVLKNKEVQLKGLILLSPAVEVKSSLAPLAALHKIYSWVPGWENGKWDDLALDVDYAKYESFAKNAGWQIYRLTGDLPTDRDLDVPVLVAASTSDETIEICGTVKLFHERIKAPNSKFILYRREKEEGLPCYEQIKQEKDADGTRKDEEKRLRDTNIAKGQLLDVAHISVPVSPSRNKHYGESGEYFSCIHYDNGHEAKSDPKKYGHCRNPSASPAEVWRGELTKDNLKKGVLRRLSYNPDFKALADDIETFVKNTRSK